MTQKEKDLLLKDLCGRLPHGVKVYHFDAIKELLGVIPSSENVMVGYDINNYEDSVIEDIKPYLRPMSSMTEEERTEREKFIKCIIDEKNHYRHYVVFPHDSVDYHDWLNAHHFDYRGLIEKGLALEAPEGIY